MNELIVLVIAGVVGSFMHALKTKDHSWWSRETLGECFLGLLAGLLYPTLVGPVVMKILAGAGVEVASTTDPWAPLAMKAGLLGLVTYVGIDVIQERLPGLLGRFAPKRANGPAAVLLAAALGLTGCANVIQFTRADVERARDIAQAKEDTAGVNCSEAILKHLHEGEGAEVPQPNGAFSAYMAARELHRSLKSAGIPEDVHIACAPLVVDAERLLLRLGIAAGGLPLPSLPIPSLGVKP